MFLNKYKKRKSKDRLGHVYGAGRAQDHYYCENCEGLVPQMRSLINIFAACLQNTLVLIACRMYQTDGKTDQAGLVFAVRICHEDILAGA